VAERRRKADREMRKLRKKGHPVSPVVIDGRTIARTFWGKAWCDNLERYSDFANRLPRGRTYVRNGSVLDLQIAPGEVKALVGGSVIYEVAVRVSAVPKKRWTSICGDCAGAIDSLVELLQGRFSKGVMERICQQKTGLFPAPVEIELSCSCPDWASMCKHVAAVLYGIGARLDDQPELLFRLRKVDEKDLIAKASIGIRLSKESPAAHKVLSAERLSELFGLEMATGEGDSASGSFPALAKPAGEGRSKPRCAVKEIPSVREARASRSAREAAPARKRTCKTEEKPGHPPKRAEAARPAKKKRNIP
jgi:uncharacterized Zn finger protein